MYVKSSLHYEQVHELEDDTVQSIWIKGGFKNSRKIFFCHAYREHTSTIGNTMPNQRDYLEKFLLQWEEASEIHNGDQPNEIHISGDMNIDALDGKWLQPTYSLVSLARMVHSTCNLGNFSQLVSLPTRFQFNSVTGATSISCIDHVYTNFKFRCSNVSVTAFGGSDHDLIGYTRYSKDPPQPARTIRRRSYKTFVAGDFLTEMRQVDWSEVLHSQDVDLAVDILTRKFRDVLNSHAPWIIYQQRKNFSPWVTKETVDLIKQRDEAKAHAEELARIGDDTTEAWNKYAGLRNTVSNRTKYEEKHFKSEKVKKSLDNPTSTWSTAKSFMNWEAASGPPNQLSIGGRLVTKAADIASEMNHFFINKVKIIRDGIRHVPNSFTKCLEIMRKKKCKLGLHHVSVSKVNKLLKNLKNSKSSSIDELDNYCIKISADVIAEPLHHIITLSIIQSKFPTSWKNSKVIPLHKKESKLERKNYRPVAILSPLSKILEKIVYEQMYEYLTKNKIFHPNLHGYRKNRSTQTALLAMYDRWVRAASNKQVSGVVLLDLSAAFDLVDPDILVKKLRIYGFDDDFLCWIGSYLTDRFQAVWIDHVLSEFLHCEVGVPQGSNLGPLFFLIFFNDLPHTVDCAVDSYADDTTLTATGKTVYEIGEKLTLDCEKVSNWMRENKLKLNPDKTHILTMGTQQRLVKLTDTVQVTMDNVVLEEDPTKFELLLGCQIQANLKWHQQVSSLIAKLRKRLTGLFHLKFICPRKIVTEGMFNSVLVYCLPLFGGLDNGQLHDLQVLQNKAAQLVCHAPPRTKRSLLFNKLGWLSVNQLISYHSMLTLFKIRSSKEPEYLSQFLCNDSRNLRIVVPNQDLTLTRNSFSFRASDQWNQLPIQLRKEVKIGTFKKDVKKWIIANVAQFLD